VKKKLNKKELALLHQGLRQAVVKQFAGHVDLFEVLRQSHEYLSLIFSSLITERAANTKEAQNTSTNSESAPCHFCGDAVVRGGEYPMCQSCIDDTV
jgi:hypothetical protein